MKRQITLTLLPIGLVIFCLTFGHITIAAPGDLDPTFGNGGLVLGPQNAEAYSTAILPDGKLIVVGNSGSYVDDPDNGTYWLPNSNIVIARYDLNGLLDTTFGSGGIVGAGVFSWVSDVVVQADGK